MKWLRVLRQGFVLFILDEETVSGKAIISWGPGIFPIQIIDPTFDDWARNKSDISRALEQGDLNSARNPFWSPGNVKGFPSGEHLIASWRGYTVEELSGNRRCKSQGGGRHE